MLTLLSMGDCTNSGMNGGLEQCCPYAYRLDLSMMLWAAGVESRWTGNYTNNVPFPDGVDFGSNSHEGHADYPISHLVLRWPAWVKMFPHHPDVVCLMAGFADIGWMMKPDRPAGGTGSIDDIGLTMAALMSQVWNSRSDTFIALIGVAPIFPGTPEYALRHGDHVERIPYVPQLNDVYRSIVAEARACELPAGFVDTSGIAREDVLGDGMHFGHSAYRKIAAGLFECLKRNGVAK